MALGVKKSIRGGKSGWVYVGGRWSGGGFNPSSTNPMTKQCPPDHQSGMVHSKTPLAFRL